MEMNRNKLKGEFVIAKTLKRRGLEGVEEATNGLAKALEGVEGVFSILDAIEQKKDKI